MLLNVISIVVTAVLFTMLVVVRRRMKRMVKDAEGFMGVRQGDEVPACDVVRPEAMRSMEAGMTMDDTVSTAGQTDAAGDMVAALGERSGEDDVAAAVDEG